MASSNRPETLPALRWRIPYAGTATTPAALAALLNMAHRRRAAAQAAAEHDYTLADRFLPKEAPLCSSSYSS